MFELISVVQLMTGGGAIVGYLCGAMGSKNQCCLSLLLVKRSTLILFCFMQIDETNTFYAKWDIII